MRTITFYANHDFFDCYKSTKTEINNSTIDIHTSQLTFISFDLLDKFDKMYINLGVIKEYELKLGQNTWIDKELRVAHNLLKLVTTHILNKI